jgi:hypothetical protein
MIKERRGQYEIKNQMAYIIGNYGNFIIRPSGCGGCSRCAED